MLKELINLANRLDQKGLRKEADFLDKIIKSAGELIFLDEKRNPQDLLDVTDRRIERNEENMTELIFLDDKETFSGEGFIVKVTEEEAQKLQEGEFSLMDIPFKRVLPIPSFKDAVAIGKK